MPDVLALHPPPGPVDARVRVPGSKSITNRALVAAALADGRSRLTGALVAEDTLAMRAVLDGLGITVAAEDDGRTLVVDGCAGRPGSAAGRLDGRSAGTVARFLPPLLALATGPSVLDGSAQMRARPLGAGVEALRALGVEVAYEGREGHLPVRVEGAGGRAAAAVRLRADVSSQYTSGLLLSAPCFEQGLTITVEGEVVSRPYLDMTVAVMRWFGARAEQDGPRYAVRPGGYTAADYEIEPDASTASYFFAAAAIGGGRVVVPGLGRDSLQGDLGFVAVLERMGCEVRVGPGETEVRGPAELRGVEVDLRDLSDTAQTLAVVAPFATSPTRITGIGFIRNKESDRVGAVATDSPGGDHGRGGARRAAHPPGRAAGRADRHLRGPPDGDELRAPGPADRGDRDRGPRLRGEDLPGLLRRPRGGDGHHRHVAASALPRRRVELGRTPAQPRAGAQAGAARSRAGGSVGSSPESSPRALVAASVSPSRPRRTPSSRRSAVSRPPASASRWSGR